jgi:hypothetical protein
VLKIFAQLKVSIIKIITIITTLVATMVRHVERKAISLQIHNLVVVIKATKKYPAQPTPSSCMVIQFAVVTLHGIWSVPCVERPIFRLLGT